MTGLPKLLRLQGLTSSRMFHYKLIIRFLSTNKYLKILRTKEDDRCTFCKQETETLAHMFWHCPRVQPFIGDIKLKLFVNFRINLNIDRKTWFFPKGISATETCMISIAKRVIYEPCITESYPSFSHFKNKLKIEIEIERHSALQTSKYDQFTKKWGPIRHVLETNSHVTYTICLFRRLPTSVMLTTTLLTKHQYTITKKD